jgi:hypothetical protein
MQRVTCRGLTREVPIEDSSRLNGSGRVRCLRIVLSVTSRCQRCRFVPILWAPGSFVSSIVRSRSRAPAIHVCYQPRLFCPEVIQSLIAASTAAGPSFRNARVSIRGERWCQHSRLSVWSIAERAPRLLKWTTETNRIAGKTFIPGQVQNHALAITSLHHAALGGLVRWSSRRSASGRPDAFQTLVHPSLGF